MSALTGTGYCRTCQANRAVTKRQFPLGTHVFLTLVTCGLWGFVFALDSFVHAVEPWRCTVCGAKTRKKLFS